MGATMADFFPPNPEDGELWLPSDIFHEIPPANIIPKNNTFHYSSVPFLAEPENPAARSLPYVKPKIGNGFLGTKPNGNRAIGGDRVPCYDRSPRAPWFGAVEVVPGHMNLYHPITPTQNQGFVKKRVEKSGGTGVFLPRTASYNYNGLRESGGTGVFLNHQLIFASQRKKNSGKNGQGKYTTEETPREKEHICLPKDWTY